MKLKKINTILSIAATVVMFFGFNSCNYLESEEYLHEVDALNDIWKTRQDLRRAWATCYGYIPNYAALDGAWPFSGAGDEGHAGLDTYTSLQWAQGKYNADNVPGTFNYWPHLYKAIRSCNLFLENSHLAEDRLLAEGEVESYNADVRFLKAYYYSILLELFGPFVIVDHTVDYSSTDLPTTRSTYDECVEYIVTQLDEVVQQLPIQEKILVSDNGRPSKGAAMALKARVLLWSASKLVNGNKDYAGFINPSGEPYINQTYIENKWRLAAQAYKDIIDLNQYTLLALPADDETVPLGDFLGNDVPWPDGPAGIDPYKSYKALFSGGVNYWNSEAIWQVLPKSNYIIYGWPRGHKGTTDTNTTGRVSAIQKIVDAFFMNNGKTIEEENNLLYSDWGAAIAGDGYYIKGRQTEGSHIQTNFLNGGGVQAPPTRCLNREPRFYATIGFTGRGYLQDDLAKPYYYADYRAQTADGYIPTDRPSVRTGYPIIKWINDKDIVQGGNFDKQNPVFRLAEVYLSYAEALNEYDPTNPDIVKYLNLVRFRAGLPGYELADQEVNRNRIKHERQIEFAFEMGKRHFDMRRWKDAEIVQHDTWGNSLGLGGMIYGCNFMETDSRFYDRSVVDGYTFKRRDYFLPLPYGEVANHWGTMTQNPGW
ncbi:MAG: RagB/SusD family nutrient uptake outer membrane protein [Candidatus Ordinivivax streblomastigis]|uniref:RagB/SusD family nutrient uptake outer membrane protein n=1 Tax=Candidatus Ordinivivax streblomastigis TaxID=2540710 RepID=A0A5M8NU17_9BACT|nr:MAG: RagB/SusD family nutrient uptake outer membrane protein [Candidatus Ordinivivax streblomastigis]